MYAITANMNMKCRHIIYTERERESRSSGTMLTAHGGLVGRVDGIVHGYQLDVLAVVSLGWYTVHNVGFRAQCFGCQSWLS